VAIKTWTGAWRRAKQLERETAEIAELLHAGSLTEDQAVNLRNRLMQLEEQTADLRAAVYRIQKAAVAL
jgi:hypothetical protein